MFCCILNRDREPVSLEVRARYATRVKALAGGEAVETIEAGPFLGWVVAGHAPLRPLWARLGCRVAVGNVRLDEPDEVRRWSGTRQADATSLDLVLSAFEVRGEHALGDILGDFGIVIYDQRTHMLLAARDAFGVKTLFRTVRERLVVFSSHLELVHDTEALDDEFVADFLVGGDPGPERTIWSDSLAVAQGSVVIVNATSITARRFWSPGTFLPSNSGDQRERVARFRELFAQGVRARLGPAGHTWAELSGGLDSSSVVSMAQTMSEGGLIPTGLAGTVSLVDRLGTGDERRYSELVVRRFGLRNTVVLDPWPWYDNGNPPPRTDEPRAHYPYFSRDKLLCDAVTEAGAKTLLTGWGPDHYLYGTPVYVSDLVARGRLLAAVRGASAWAIARRQSAWATFAREGLVPLLPRRLQYPFTPEWDSVPDWIRPAFAKRLCLAERLDISRVTRAARGSRFTEQIMTHLSELTCWLPRGEFERRLDLRHPFLYRPLVEYGLGLDVHMRARPSANKWILREAMKGVLPERVRTRSGKGGIDARILWALSRERGRISEILDAPALEESGFVDARRLRSVVETAREGRIPQVLMLLCVLGLETWLFVRAGRWIVRS